MDRSSVWIAMVDMSLAILAVVIVSVNPPAPVKAGVDEKAEYLVSAEWSVDRDIDVDLHMMPPRGKPVFFASREVGCSNLDRDNRGFLDSLFTLADGSQTKIDSNRETIAIRCKEFGHYDVAVNVYSSRSEKTDEIQDLKVHVEITGLNPSVKMIFTKDVTLNHVGQTINVASFDMARDGGITFVDPPLTPITDGYQKRMHGEP